MPIEKIVNAIGTIDDVNTAFSVGEAYVAGTLVPRLNGQEMLHRDGAPFTEDDPSTGAFSMGEAPEVGDTLSARFIDTSPIAPEAEVIEIEATIELETEISSTVAVETAIDAQVETEVSLSAEVQIETAIDALVEPELGLSATVEVCD
jgi:hypothetical protein